MPEVWEQLVESDAFAVTSPWARGSKHLPKTTDIARILSHTSQVYLTANTVTGAWAGPSSRATPSWPTG